MFGNCILAGSLISQGLIDECRMMVCPVVLGTARQPFAGIGRKLELKFLRAECFKSGNVLFYYESAK